MKKIHLLALFLLFAGSVSAQYYDPNRPARRPRRVQQHQQQESPVQIGITAGLNVANTVDAYDANYSTSTIAGFHAGLTFDVPIAYNFSFAPEVVYSQKGYAARTIDGDFTQRFNFIDVPLLAKFKIGPGVNFFLGPQISFLASSNATFDNGFTVVNQNNYNYNGDNTFIDGVAGVSFDINRYFDIRARYAIDLNQTHNNNAAIPDYRNQVWQFGFGIKFN